MAAIDHNYYDREIFSLRNQLQDMKYKYNELERRYKLLSIKYDNAMGTIRRLRPIDDNIFSVDRDWRVDDTIDKTK